MANFTCRLKRLLVAASMLGAASLTKAYAQQVSTVYFSGQSAMSAFSAMDDAWMSGYGMSAPTSLKAITFEENAVPLVSHASAQQNWNNRYTVSYGDGSTASAYFLSGTDGTLSDGYSTWTVPQGSRAMGLGGASSFKVDFSTAQNWFSFYVNDLDKGNAWVSFNFNSSSSPASLLGLSTTNSSAYISGSSLLIPDGASDYNAFVGIYVPQGFNSITVNLTAATSSDGYLVDYFRFAATGNRIYWNAANAASTTPSGGAGTWNGSNTNWLGAESGAIPSVFQSGRQVVFSGPAYASSVVGLAGGVYNVASLAFFTSGYVVGSSVNDGTIAIAAGGDIYTSADVTIRSKISGPVTKSGVATLRLEGSSAISALSVLGGRLVVTGQLAGFSQSSIAAGATLELAEGSGASVGYNISNAGQLIFSQASTTTFSGNQTSYGQLVKRGAATLYLTGANDMSSVSVEAGILSVGNGGTTGALSGAVAISAGAGIVFDRSDSATFGGGISGVGTVTKRGAGILTLSGFSSYTGGTTVSEGTLRLTGRLGGDSASYEGAVVNAGIVDFASASGQAMAGVISGAGSLLKSGSGSLTLSATNTYSGGTAIGLVLAVAGRLGKAMAASVLRLVIRLFWRASVAACRRSIRCSRKIAFSPS